MSKNNYSFLTWYSGLAFPSLEEFSTVCCDHTVKGFHIVNEAEVDQIHSNKIKSIKLKFSSVQSLSHVWLFAIPWTAAHWASLSITNSRSLPKLVSIELVMPSSHLILCRPLLFFPQSLPASGSFPMSQLFAWGGQSTGVSASASVLPMNTQDWSPLGWTGWIALQSKGLSRVFSNTTVQKHQFFGTQLSSQSNSHIHTWPLEKPQPWLEGPLLAK